MAGYGDDTAFTAWLASRGLTLPVGAPSPEVLRQRGSDYLDATYGPRLICSAPTGGLDQERAWPRTGHMLNGQSIASDAIPAAWVRASYRAAWLEASRSDSLSATVRPDQRKRREKVDVIEREFFDAGEIKIGGGNIAVVDAEIDGLVAPFLCASRFASFLVV
jgi:hypothetical protein